MAQKTDDTKSLTSVIAGVNPALVQSNQKLLPSDSCFVA